MRVEKDSGKIYVLPMDGRKKKKTAWTNFFFVSGLLAVQVVAGLLNPDSSHTFWIVYPYLFIYLPLFYAFFGVYSYAETGLRIPDIQYKKGLVRIRHSLLGVLVLAAINVLLDIVYMLVYRSEIRLGVELLYCFMFLLLIAGVILYGKFYDRAYSGITVE